MEINIQSFKIEYLPQVLNCWNENLVYDLINEERFTKIVLLDDNFDPNLLKVALLDNEVIGFCFGIKRKIPYLERGLEPKRGWINMIAVHKEYRRQGIAKKLVECVEHELSLLGTTDMTLCAYSPNYFTPGIDLRYQGALLFFEKLGYQCGNEAVSMQRDLWDFQMSEKAKEKRKALEQEGIRIISYEKKYMLKLLEFVFDEFGSGWKRNVLMAMQKQIAEQTILLCVNQNEDILGFCMRNIDGHEGRFGPVGISESLRSKGIGGVLFECMMHDMKSRGIPYLYFLWTSGAAQRFYDRYDLKVFRTYRMYRKVIKE